jgi:hypothetical protein
MQYWVGTYQDDLTEGNYLYEADYSEFILVTDVTIHPLYDFTEYDIAILKIERPVYNPRPLDLDSGYLWQGDNIPMRSAFVLGYGAYDESDRQSIWLRAAAVSLYTREECKGAIHYSHVPHITKNCAFGQATDSCSGDSGGPLLVAHDGTFIQVGIVSYGLDAPCSTHQSGHYTVVSQADMKAFIRENTNGTKWHESFDINDSCDCITDCQSNGFGVDTSRCGCLPNTDGRFYCYTVGMCPHAEASQIYFGAWYRNCEDTHVLTMSRKGIYIMFSLNAKGTIEDYDTDRKFEIRSYFAYYLSIPIEHISLIITSGSITMDITLLADDDVESTRLYESVGALLSNTTELGEGLDIDIVNTTSVTRRVVLPEVADDRENTTSSDSGGDDEFSETSTINTTVWIMFIIYVSMCGLLVVCFAIHRHMSRHVV